MRIAVHDFAGHPFQLELSRELAKRGHDVVHLYPPDVPGPKGLTQKAGESARFTAQPVELPRSFRKYSPLRRLITHREYAANLTAAILDSRCDLVLSANAPIDVQHRLLTACSRHSIPLLHWMQDIYCLAVQAVLANKLGRLGTILPNPFRRLERLVAERSAGVICITGAFQDYFASDSIQPQRLWVIENWTPLDEVKPLPKENPWSRGAGLDGKNVLLYSGTMGIKHNPDLMYRLALSFQSQTNVACAVVSEGLGRAYLERKPKTAVLRLFDFQPYSRLSEVLAAADVLVAVIEPGASRFSVPSKVLSYLAAGRPVLLAAPPNNLAAQVVRRAGAGIVVDPHDVQSFIRAGRQLIEDKELRALMSANARKYAESHFRIGPIADAFESAIFEVTGQPMLAACSV